MNSTYNNFSVSSKNNKKLSNEIVLDLKDKLQTFEHSLVPLSPN